MIQTLKGKISEEAVVINSHVVGAEVGLSEGAHSLMQGVKDAIIVAKKAIDILNVTSQGELKGQE